MDETEFPPAGLVLIEHVGAGDVGGHQVGRELNQLERDIENLGDRADEQGFGQPRHPDQQTVAAGEDGGQKLLDHFFLPDDDLTEFFLHQLSMLAELLQELVEIALLLIRQGTPFQSGYLGIITKRTQDTRNAGELRRRLNGFGMG